MSCVVAIFSTMFMANEVFPIAGRAASSTRSVSCRPLVSASNCVNPVFSPWKASLSLLMALKRSSTAGTTVSILTIVEVSSDMETLKISFSANATLSPLSELSTAFCMIA